MKKTLRYSLVLIVLTGFYSCKSILLRTSGVSQPKLETKESIITYLSENSFDPGGGVFTAKDSTSFSQLINLIRSLPSVDFYNPKGELIEYSTTGDCTSKAENFAVGLTQDALFKIDSSYQFDDVKDKVINIDGKSKLSLDNADFTLLIFWSKYLGKMNKSVMKVNKILQDNKKTKTNIYLVNMDFQLDWGLKAIPGINIK